MSCIYTKSGVEFTKIAPGGFAILGAFITVANDLGLDMVITSACDGAHSGPNDPHHRGEAYDFRSHDFAQDVKDRIVAMVSGRLGPLFYVFLESPGTDNEHIHAQVAKGKAYPDPTQTSASGAGGGPELA